MEPETHGNMGLFIIDPPAYITNATAGNTDAANNMRASVIDAASNLPGVVIISDNEDGDGEEEEKKEEEKEEKNTDFDSDSTITDPDMQLMLNVRTSAGGASNADSDIAKFSDLEQPSEWNASTLTNDDGVVINVHVPRIIGPVTTSADPRTATAAGEQTSIVLMIQEYLLNMFHVLVPLPYITTGPTADVPGFYVWNTHPPWSFGYFRQRSSANWTPEELTSFPAALGRGVSAVWGPKVGLPKELDIEQFLKPYYETNSGLEIKPLSEPFSFHTWYHKYTGEDWDCDTPSLQALLKIPGIGFTDFPAIEKTKESKFYLLNLALRQRDNEAELLWDATMVRLALKRKIDFFLTGLDGIDVGETRRQMEADMAEPRSESTSRLEAGRGGNKTLVNSVEGSG